MKLTKRKGFNFFRSYYDVYNELETDKDKAAFIDALLDRQFLGIKPTDLKGMAKFAYISQTNSIDSQVKGYEDKTGKLLNFTPTLPPTYGGTVPPTLQVQVQVQEKEKEKEKEKVQEQLNMLEKSKRFIPPTLQEVEIYCFERVNGLDPKHFIDHYTSNGWLVGKNKMKDWQSAIRNWERTNKNFNTNKNGNKPRNQTTEEGLRAFLED
jgi:hypothetical protein